MNIIIYHQQSQRKMYSYTANRYSLDPPPFLQSEYKMASNRLEQELPLPGHSVKLPYKEQPTRFLNLNRKKHEIDYLRDQIQHKVKMEELHYQARLEQMRKENQLNRYRLEQMLREHPERNLYAAPHQIAEDAKSDSNLSNLSLNELLKKRNKLIFEDSIDKVKAANLTARSQGGQRHSQSAVLEDSDSSNQTEKKYKEKVQRQEDLDYIYKKRDNPKSQKSRQHFSVDLRKQNNPDDMDEEKRKEYEWVKRVRKARGNPIFVVPEVKSDDTSSSASSKKESVSKKSSISKPSTRKENIFARKEDSSDNQSKQNFHPITHKPPSSVRKITEQHLRTPRPIKKQANPERSIHSQHRFVDKYRASENSSLNSSSISRRR